MQHYSLTLRESEYGTNDEYRDMLFDFCLTRPWDDVFDKLSSVADVIYAETREIPVFVDVYTLAANHVLSDDPNIGINMLFSYDYFSDFYKCLVDFKTDDTLFGEGNPHYIKLKSDLVNASRKK